MSSPTPITPANWKDLDESKRALYVAYLDDFGRIGSRHETVRAFYLTILTLLLGLVASAGVGGGFEAIRWQFLFALGLVGMIICIAWACHMSAFQSLFDLKRETLRKLEGNADFPIKPFTREAAGEDPKRTHTTKIDKWVALSFLVLFILLLGVKSWPTAET